METLGRRDDEKVSTVRSSVSFSNPYDIGGKVKG